MCDEFIGHCLDIHTIELIKKIESSSESLELADLRNQLVAIVADERKYKHFRIVMSRDGVIEINEV